MLEYKNPKGYANLTPYHSLADKGKYRPVVYICSAYSGDMENKKILVSDTNVSSIKHSPHAL